MPRAPRLAVDVGTVRVGLAASDPDGILATPVATLSRSSSLEQVVGEIRDRGAGCVYVGLPRQLSGAEGASAAAARAYAECLAREVAPVSVRLLDERLSTTVAQQALRAAGRSSRDHRSVIDQAAAVVILQDALEAERTTGSRPGTAVVPGPVGSDQPTTAPGISATTPRGPHDEAANSGDDG
ncbi:MAG: Holliday junction resolvase RuvX [Micrococcales bacterium]|nr:Holliday junction resolvase RuvX [Micrococcales bacterium]